MPNPLRLLPMYAVLLLPLSPSVVQATPLARSPLSSYSAAATNPSPIVTTRALEYVTVQGVVTDSMGQPVADALIAITNSGSGNVIIRRTSSAGEFSVDSLIEGNTYTITAARLGYAATETQPFTANIGPRQRITVIMKHRPTVTIPAGGWKKMADSIS